ncbi:uncharacterized protein [Branchiostoma lanceolatum]|uniref:uncharacterized protein isoform X2 n=1 Tax=Branchiostoma lanceolatum TaxID=7740 RepID=UPI0034550D97
MIRQLEENTQHRISQKDEFIQQLQARVDVLESEKEEGRTEAAAKIRELEKRLVDQAVNTRQRVSLKDEKICKLKSRVEVLESEKKGFHEARLHVHTQTQQGKNVLIDPRPILQDIQRMRKENEQKTAHQQELVRKMREQLEANKGVVKTLKQELTEQIGAHEHMHGKVKKDTTGMSDKKESAASDVPLLLINSLPLQDDEKNKQADKETVAFEVPTLLINGLPLQDDEKQKEADEKEVVAFEVPTLLINGLPLQDDGKNKQADKEAVTFQVPTLLINGLPLQDDEKQKEADEKEAVASGVPTLHINGVPLQDGEQHEPAAVAVPKVLLNDLPLQDDLQHVQTEKEAATVAMAKTDKPVKDNEDIPQYIPDGYPPTNGANEGETFGKEPAIPQGFVNRSLPSGDANITETSGNPELELPCLPEFLAVQSVTQILVEHRVYPHSSMVHFFPLDVLDEAFPDSLMKQYLLSQGIAAYAQQARLMCAMDRGLKNVPPENSYTARKSASSPAQACLGDYKLNHSELQQRTSVGSRASLDSLSTPEVGGGDIKPQCTGEPSCGWKLEKPPKHHDSGEQNMSLLDFIAVDEPRGLEVLIERRAPRQFWSAPDVVRGDEPGGLEIVIETSFTPEHVHTAQQKVMQRCQLTDMFRTALTNDMATASCHRKSHKFPGTEGEDAASFPLALLKSRIMRGYRLTTALC